MIAKGVILGLSGIALVSGVLVILDSVYFGTPQLTVMNSFLYNLDPANLAAHGIHPRYLHVLVNMHVLFGPLHTFAMILVAWNSLRLVRQLILNPRSIMRSSSAVVLDRNMDRRSPPGSPTMINSASWGRLRSRLDGPLTRSRMSDSAIRSSDLSYNSKDNEPSKATTIRLVLLGCIFSGCGLLSVAQHQEPRFLLPLLLPLCVLFAPRFFCFRWWIVSWIIFNISLLVFFGVLHQGGVIPSLIYTQQESLSDTYAGQAVDPVHGRSEERRVGKEC